MRRLIEEFFPLLTVVDEGDNFATARLDNSPYSVCLSITYRGEVYYFVFTGTKGSASETREISSNSFIISYNTVNSWLSRYI